MTVFCKNINPKERRFPGLSNFAIMRWGKIKLSGIANSEYHQRTELHKNCEHPELREQNFTFRQFEEETLRQTTKRLMAAQQERTGRAVRKDATVMVDFVLTFSPEMVGKIDMEEWFKANVDWLHQEFGAKNLLRLDMHFHESNPHLHAFVSPLDENGNFNFKRYVKHISQLVHLQDRYAKAMEQFGLERGQTRWAELDNGQMKATSDIVRHKPLRAWRSELVEQINRMQEQLQALPEISEEQQKALQELQRVQQQVESRKGTKKKLDAQVEDLQKDVENLTGQKQTLTTEIKGLQKAKEDAQVQYLNLKAEAERLKGVIAQKQRELTEYVFSDRNSVPEVPRGALHLGEADDILDL